MKISKKDALMWFEFFAALPEEEELMPHQQEIALAALAQIETAVRLSGLTKQDYITRRLLCRDVVVQGNPRVYKALRNELAAVLEELERIEAGNGVDGELLDTIRLIAAIMDGMRED